MIPFVSGWSCMASTCTAAAAHSGAGSAPQAHTKQSTALAASKRARAHDIYAQIRVARCGGIWFTGICRKLSTHEEITARLRSTAVTTVAQRASYTAEAPAVRRPALELQIDCCHNSRPECPRTPPRHPPCPPFAALQQPCPGAVQQSAGLPRPCSGVRATSPRFEFAVADSIDQIFKRFDAVGM